jgi:cytochrome c556
MPDPQDVIAFRYYLMENIGSNAKELKAKIDTGKLKEAKLNAQVLAIHATRIEALFPEGGTTDASRAKAEIWQNWDAFLALASTLSTEADTLAVAAGHGEEAEVKAQMKKVFGTCKSCHDQFRKPEK